MRNSYSKALFQSQNVKFGLFESPTVHVTMIEANLILLVAEVQSDLSSVLTFKSLLIWFM